MVRLEAASASRCVLTPEMVCTFRAGPPTMSAEGTQLAPGAERLALFGEMILVGSIDKGAEHGNLSVPPPPPTPPPDLPATQTNVSIRGGKWASSPAPINRSSFL